MPLKQTGPVRHEVEERYQVELVYTRDEIGNIVKLTPEGEVVPDKITLVWTRRRNGKWMRRTAGRYGSTAEGFVKGPYGWREYGPRARKEIFGRSLGELKGWATLLPALREAVEDIESRLPS